MVDFIIKLLLIARKNAILVICNKLSKIAYFVVITEEILVERLVRLFRDNIQKLYKLLKSMILDKRLQFAAELTKELNKMLDIKMKLLILFHLQIYSQTK